MIEKHRTKLILEERLEIRTFEFSYDLSTRELVQEMYLLCLASGHDQYNVAESFYTIGKEIVGIENDPNDTCCTTGGTHSKINPSPVN